MKKLLIPLLMILVSCAEFFESGAIDGYEKYLARGQYETAINALKMVKPSSKRYKEAQALLVNLEAGFQIFSTATGSWRYEDGGHIYPISVNGSGPGNGTWLYKREGNTVYTVASKCHGTGSALTECPWVLDMRYLGYDGKTLKVRRYFAAEDKFQDMRIFR